MDVRIGKKGEREIKNKKEELVVGLKVGRVGPVLQEEGMTRNTKDTVSCLLRCNVYHNIFDCHTHLKQKVNTLEEPTIS